MLPAPTGRRSRRGIGSPRTDRGRICKILRFSELYHYNDVIMGTIASQITSLTIVYSIVYSDADQRKHQSSASLAFVRGIPRGPVNSPHKWPVTRKNVSIWWRHHDDAHLCMMPETLSHLSLRKLYFGAGLRNINTNKARQNKQNKGGSLFHGIYCTAGAHQFFVRL